VGAGALAGRMSIVPRPYPKEFRADVVAVARRGDRIRTAKDTGLNNLPLASFAANQIWCAVVALAAEITAWMQMLAFTNTETARRWEPKRLRYRIFTILATLARSGRRIWLHLSTRSPWAALTLTGLERLADLAPS